MTKRELWDLLSAAEKDFMRQLAERFDIALIHCRARYPRKKAGQDEHEGESIG